MTLKKEMKEIIVRIILGMITVTVALFCLVLLGFIAYIIVDPIGKFVSGNPQIFVPIGIFVALIIIFYVVGYFLIEDYKRVQKEKIHNTEK